MSALPNRDRRAERREATRREILDAAWELARADGLAAVTLRGVAERVGMRSPSLYTHFESKNAIYDAMFGQAWSEYLAVVEALEARLVRRSPRKALLVMVTSFADFCVADLVRFQLMNQRMIVDFSPSEASYAPSVRVMELFEKRMADLGVARAEDVDLCVAIVGGLIDAQFANDAGGDRFVRLLPRAIDVFADDVGLPGPKLRRNR
jgi:AcrR family transcriptional regulator